MENKHYKEAYDIWTHDAPAAVIERATAVANFHMGMLYSDDGKLIPFHMLPRRVLLAIKKVHGGVTNYTVEPYDFTPALERIVTIMAHDVDKKRMKEIKPTGSQEDIDDTMEIEE